jgi:hypothetical protein
MQLKDMTQLSNMKMLAAGGWVLIVFVAAVTIGVSGTGTIAAAAFGFLPPLALLLLWNDPPQTLSESINKARR